jgi:hypothetical protein
VLEISAQKLIQPALDVGKASLEVAERDDDLLVGVLAVFSEFMLGVFESLRVADEVTASEALKRGCTNGSCFCADMAVESRRSGDQDETRLGYRNWDSDGGGRVAGCMSSREATNNTSNADARCGTKQLDLQNHGCACRIRLRP